MDLDEEPGGGDHDPSDVHDPRQETSTIDQERARKRVPAHRARPVDRGPKPQHPSGAAALLMIGVVLLIFAIAAVSTFSR